MLHSKMKNQSKDKHDTYGLFGFTLLKSKEFTPAEKLIAQYMLHRYKFFSKDGGKYYDTQSAIGEACGLSPRTVVTSITKLIESGLVKSFKVPNKAGRNNLYEVFDFIQLPNAKFENEGSSHPELHNEDEVVNKLLSEISSEEDLDIPYFDR